MSKWKKVKIGDLLLRSKIPIDIEDTEEYKRVTIRIKHQGVSLRDIEIGKKIGTKKQFVLKSGQFLMSKIDARYGAFGIAGDDVDDAIITGNFWAYDINSSLTTVEWINKYTNSPAFYDLCERASSGVTHRRYLNEQTFLNHELYIPSIDEQSKILFSNREKTLLLNNLENELNKQEKYVSQLKQAVLQEAIAGQLTAEWRTQNPMQKGNPDTDAAALLAKIKSEKQRLIADGKLKKEKPLAEIAIDEIPFSIPDNWVWCSLVEIAEGFEYGSSTKSLDSGKVPVLRMGNLQSGLVDFKNLVYTNDDDEIEQYALSYGDLLFNRTNSRELVGKTSLFLCNEKMIYAGYLVRYKMLGTISFHYANYVMNSQLHRDWCYAVKIDAIGQSNINATKLRSFPFPLPPLAEQKAIVEKVDKLMNIIDRLEQQIKHRKQLAEDLMQTVLREAFE
jgi:type I restriction enzyme S subunit